AVAIGVTLAVAVVAEVEGDQVGDDFGVGVALEVEALGFELPAQGGVVLDHAVVDQGQDAVAADVGVGGAVVGGAVGGPAGVAAAGGAGGRLVAQVADQFLDPAGALAQVHVRAAEGGQTGAVIAAVFQPAQALDQDRFGLAR